MSDPQSRLTAQRHDIWARGLDLAVDLTGYQFPAKQPLADGTITACGYGYNHPPDNRTPLEKINDAIKEAKRSIKYWKDLGRPDDFHDEMIRYEEEKLEKLKQEKKSLAPAIFVPEGAMEWLLHEVGHWVASTPEERMLTNYGYDTFQKGSGHGDAREWQAWAFEEIILAPFGQSRNFAAPSYRGGTAFRKAEPIPNSAFIHIEERMRNQGIHVDQFRGLWEEWIAWGKTLGPEAPWLS